MCCPGQSNITSFPDSSSSRKPSQSSWYSFDSRSGTTSSSSTRVPSRNDPNHALSFGTTIVSSLNRISTRRSKRTRFALYLGFFSGFSLLTSGRNALRARYFSKSRGSRKYCACTTVERAGNEYAAARTAASAARQYALSVALPSYATQPGRSLTPACCPPMVTSRFTFRRPSPGRSPPPHRCTTARMNCEPWEKPTA